MKWRVRTMFEGDLEYEEVYTTRSWKQAVREHLDDLRVAGEYDTMTIVVEREE